MRIYIELYEVLPPESTGEADFVRIDVTVWDPKDVDTLIGELRSYADSNYSSYVLQKHICFHDEEPKKPCSIEIIASR